MKLCHKCKGTFVTYAGLNHCQCISGYERGFEPDLSIAEAATQQAKREIEWIALYVSQQRDAEDRAFSEALTRLRIAMNLSPVFGHGTVEWDKLTDKRNE